MNLTTERADILAALTKVAGIVARKTTIDIIANVLIDARKSGDVHLRATNLDMEATAVFRGNVTTPGKITTPAASLFDIVRSLGAGADLSLATQENDPRMRLTSGRSRFNLPVLPASDFPALRTIAEPAKITMPGGDLASMLARVAFAVGSEQTRFYLCGVYVHSHEGRLQMVATNGHRLAFVVGPDVEANVSAILPVDFVTQCQRLLADFGDDVTLSVGESMVSIEAGETVLTSKILDATYPDYQRVIPKDNQYTLTVGRAAMEGAIKRAMLVGTTAISLTIEADSMAVAARGENAGDALDEISAEYDGEPVVIKFNGPYLLDALAMLRSETVNIAIKDRTTPVRITDSDDAATLFIVHGQHG